MNNKKEDRPLFKGLSLFLTKRGLLFLLSNQVTLLLMILMIKVSLRAKRGNLIKRISSFP